MMTDHSHRHNSSDEENTITRYQLGFTREDEAYQKENQWEDFIVARVVREDKERYLLRTEKGVFPGEILGNLRYTADSRLDYPVVGDWVACMDYGDTLLIHGLFPRKSLLKRKAPGSKSEEQPIVANINTAFIVQSANRDFNFNRLERYLTICFDAGIEAVLLLSKIDLLSDEEKATLISNIRQRMKGVAFYALSCISGEGIAALKDSLVAGKTYGFLGSSGVGKSSLINVLMGKEEMKTRAITRGAQRGKHTTTHRALLLMPTGSILIDNPGMRELALGDAAAGLKQTFDEIIQLAVDCRFADCSHTHEKNCAVLWAVEQEYIARALYDNYLKLQREQAYFEENDFEKRKKGKAFSKMVKQVKRYKK